MADVFTMMNHLPEGYHFSPRDYEFINYLRRRKNDEPQPFNNRFVEINLYGLKHPSQLFEGTSEKEIFFFTTLKKKNSSSRRVIRTAGDGTWKSQHTVPVDDPHDYSPINKRSIGDHTSLKFEVPSSGGGDRYIMHEYSLLKSENYLGVACMIKKEPPQKGSSSFHREEERQEVITEHGKKRGREQDFGGGEEECLGPHNKNMRLQCVSDYDASSSQPRNSQSELLPVDEDLDAAAVSQWVDGLTFTDLEGSETTDYFWLRDLEQQLNAPLENDECFEFPTVAEIDNQLKEFVLTTNNVDAASTQGETSNAPAAEHNALVAYDDRFSIWEPTPVATDQPYHEASTQQQGYKDAFSYWSMNPFTAPYDGHMNQASAAPEEWQQNLMQQQNLMRQQNLMQWTYTTDQDDKFSAFY